MEFKDKKIAVLGLGVEGVSSLKFLKRQGAQVTCLDQKDGKDYLNNLSEYDIIIHSPGIKPTLPELLEAEKKGTIITSQTKIFFDLCPCPIIGVTGTKGKGTTSTLIYEMLKNQGLDAYLGGNIGVAPLDFLDKLKKDSWVVLELSSFQLQDLHKSPHISIMLMTVSEHLDYHSSIEEYVDAKRNILRFQTKDDFAVLNRDYPASNESDIFTEGKVLYVSRERDVLGDGCFVIDGKIMMSITSNKSSRSTSQVIDTKKILLPGKHNLENVCAAVMAATLAGVEKENIVKVLKTFKGLEHRLELVEEINGVKYYDDSFSTTPETAIAAIQAFKQPEILILGGSSKNSDFTELGQIIEKTENIKAIIGIGVEWEKIKEKIYDLKFKIYEDCKNMQEIVENVSKIAEPGDVVLLSPACASFGMFKNYKDRGEQFKKEVKNLISNT